MRWISWSRNHALEVVCLNQLGRAHITYSDSFRNGPSCFCGKNGNVSLTSKLQIVRQIYWKSKMIGRQGKGYACLRTAGTNRTKFFHPLNLLNLFNSKLYREKITVDQMLLQWAQMWDICDFRIPGTFKVISGFIRVDWSHLYISQPYYSWW